VGVKRLESLNLDLDFSTRHISKLRDFYRRHLQAILESFAGRLAFRLRGMVAAATLAHAGAHSRNRLKAADLAASRLRIREEKVLEVFSHFSAAFCFLPTSAALSLHHVIQL
jgi:hypothetical protein